MAPVVLVNRASNAINAHFAELKTQWRHPTNVLDILMVVGGEIIRSALAQLSGGNLTPVTFSFGWVGYGISGLLTVAGDNKLMPPPDTHVLVINGQSGYARQNRSWIIGRLMRDIEYWMDPRIRDAIQATRHDLYNILLKKNPGVTPKMPHHRIGLCVSVYEACGKKKAGTSHRDWVYYSGFFVMVLQLVVSIIPVIVDSDWMIFFVTFCGTIMALATGAIPQWRNEKWSCAKDTTKISILTEGNGSQHVCVIIGNGNGLDFEALANDKGHQLHYTRFYMGVLAIFWLLLLISVAGLDKSSWYLLAIGTIGMTHNFVVAGAPRYPSAFGVHLKFKKVFSAVKVMDALKRTEEELPRVGAYLVKEFFPGKLREDEKLWWAKREAIAEAAEKKTTDIVVGNKEMGRRRVDSEETLTNVPKP